jgi:flagellar assembly factor FliW
MGFAKRASPEKFMNTVEQTDQAKLPVRKENLIQVPLGLLGFEENHNYVLLTNAEEEPFMWLQMLDTPKHTFLVISPFEVLPDYQPDVSPDDVQSLGLTDPRDAIVLCIVNLRSSEQPTINLKGPILINRHTLVGKQIIPLNASECSLHFPLPVAG